MKRILLFALALCVPVVIAAQPGPGGGPGGGMGPGKGPRGPMMWKMIDTNGDGKVNQAEWQAHFAQMDANKDGGCDAAEIRKLHMGGMGMGPGAGRSPRMLSVLDLNKNGKVDAAEWEQHFKSIDKDKNGELDQSEFAAHRSAMWGN